MKDAPVGTAVIKLALPMMAGMLAQSIYSLADMFFIGQTGDASMVAAVSLAFPVFMLIQSIGNIFAVGGASYISRMLGAKRGDEARHTSVVSLYFAILAGVAFSVLLWVFKDPLLWTIGASQATFAYADSFLSILTVFLTFGVAATVMGGQMRSEGATNQAMKTQVFGLALNIVLNPILILGFHLGPAGSAWATAAGQILSCGYGIHYFLSKKTLLSIRPAEFKPNGVMVRQVLSIGIPEGLSSMVMGLSFMLGNYIASSYGDYVIAGNGVQMRFTGMFFMLVFALVLGYQPFAGYNFGAGRLDRVRKGFKLTIIYATCLCLAGTALAFLFGESVIRLFINDTPTVAAGTAMMHAFACGLPFVGVQTTFLVSFQAFGKPIQAMVITLGRQLLFYVPLLFILNNFFAFSGFIWAQPGSDILTTLIALTLSFPLLKLMRGNAPAAKPQIPPEAR
ncbi:MAG: MATE family efflux transporter [Eggerthellaceae bacterium]|nr:MATE family efflux transporter [Eggerthellaceae bacterium]